MTTKFKSGWYVIYTRPKQEKKVAGALSEIGIDHLLPTARTLRTWSDRKKYIDAPMFPSYIFVHLKQRQDYFNALNIDGALFYIRFGQEVAMVRNHVIDGLRLILENSPDVEVSNLRFQPGQQLVIQEGVFAGLTCEVVEHKNQQKMIVRINLLNTNVLASIPPGLTQSVGALPNTQVA
jgi:transcriptional antiterminator RfaH